ncbi:uncharacterized protein [Aquarana catesbeiana]|uniref:uncharacterized protein n=1 Tax=Aquarana catesbeiana TaxID=8400 RepID=UPI003CCA21BC
MKEKFLEKQVRPEKMTSLIPPQTSGKAFCLLFPITLMVFPPIWVITNCIYHPEDLGAIKNICGNTYTQKNITVIQVRNKRDIEDNFADKMLLLKFKYAYARKSGFQKCWICSKLHPSTVRIPLMAIPLNITPLLREEILLDLLNVSRITNDTISFHIINRSHNPTWCFNLGNSTRNAHICSQSVLNISNCYAPSGKFCSLYQTHHDEVRVRADFEKILASEDESSKSVQYLFQVLAAVTAVDQETAVNTPFSFGNHTYVCCGKTCYPWIPQEVQGWCYLASLVPIMGVIGYSDGSHLLEASIHPRYPLKHRNKRELFLEKDMAWAWFPSWTGWGIDLMKRLNNYSGIIDEMMEKNSDDISKLNVETRAIRKQLELHDLAIESMSSALTGLCEMTEDYECCTWVHNTSIEVPDYYDVIAQHRKEVAKLQQEACNIAQTWSPFGNVDFGFGGIFSWIRDIAIILIIVVFFFLFLYLVYKLIMCLINRATRISDPSSPNKTYLSMYHQKQAENIAMIRK